jgi:hypothetical protein
MTKITLLISAVLFLAASPAFARGHHHQPVPPPIVTPVTIPSGIQFGMYNNEKKTQYGTYTGFFFGDGDDFTEDLASQNITGPIFAYWESSYTAQQIENGDADSFLKVWASEMKSYGQPVIFAPLDEMNGDWSPYYGNPTAFKAAWIHIHSLFSGDSNVKFAYDPNVCGTGMSCSALTAYYPGSAYVDIVGLDGFDFGGQNFSQVFSESLPVMQAFGKPLWATSIGAVSLDNQSAFLQAAFASGAKGIIYFNQSPFTLGSAALGTLKALL